MSFLVDSIDCFMISQKLLSWLSIWLPHGKNLCHVHEFV